MNRYPNNYSQHGNFNSNFRPRTTIRPTGPRFHSNRFTGPSATGRDTYQPKAVYNYRTAQPNRFQTRNNSPNRLSEQPVGHGGQFGLPKSSEADRQTPGVRDGSPLQIQGEPQWPQHAEPSSTGSLHSKRDVADPQMSQGNNETSGQFGNLENKSDKILKKTNTNQEVSQSGQDNIPNDFGQFGDLGNKKELADKKVPDKKDVMDTSQKTKVDQAFPHASQCNTQVNSNFSGQFGNLENKKDVINLITRKPNSTEMPGVALESEDKAQAVEDETTTKQDEGKDKTDEGGDEEDENDDDDDGSSDEDTSYCKYCKRNFTSAVAYHFHTRGMVHMNLYMEAKAAKNQTQTDKENETSGGEKGPGVLRASEPGIQKPVSQGPGPTGPGPVDDGKKKKGSLSIQPGQMNMFFQEKNLKKKESQKKKLAGKDTSQSGDSGQTDSQTGESNSNTEGQGQIDYEIDAENPDYNDEVEMNEYGMMDENADYGGDKISQFYNYETSRSDPVKQTVAESMSYNTSGSQEAKERTQGFGYQDTGLENRNQTGYFDTGRNYGFDKSRQNFGYESYGNKGERYDSAGQYTDIRQYEQYYEDQESYGTELAPARPSQGYTADTVGYDVQKEYRATDNVYGDSTDSCRTSHVYETRKDNENRGQFDKIDNPINTWQNKHSFKGRDTGDTGPQGFGNTGQGYGNRGREYGNMGQEYGNKGQGYGNKGWEYGHMGHGYGNTMEENEETEEELKTQLEEEEEEEEEDTSFCKYCQLPFKTPVAYHTHTRGLQHTTLIMKAREKKGDKRFRKEKVDPAVLQVEIPEPKPEKPKVTEADIPEDYDFEKNWMNLDDDMIKRLQSRTKPAERDLNPDDIGKKQFCEDFTCAVCNIKCTSAMTFKMHIEGKAHKANMDHLESGNKYKIKQKKSGNAVYAAVDGEDVQSQFAKMTQDYTENALLGLEFITEFQKPDPKAACRYVCNLCQAKCDASTVMPHVTGVKHRLHYFRETHYEIYQHLTKFTSKKKKSEMNTNAEDFAKQIEEKEGRKDVKVKIELDAGSGENDLTEIMSRMSKALREKLKEVEKKKEDQTENEDENTKSSTESAVQHKEEKPGPSMGRGRPGQQPRERMGPWGPHRGPYGEDPYGDSRDPYQDRWDRPDRFRYPRDYIPQRDRYGPFRDPYSGPRDPYLSERDYYGREPMDPYRGHFGDKFHYEEESQQLDLMLDHHLSDPFEEYRRLDDLYYRQRHLRMLESRRLDDLLLDRHKLADPALEMRRLEDILERKQKLADMEKIRLDDIMRRKQILEENDPDKLRLQRYEKLRKTTMEQDVTAARESERPSLEELIARRRANYAPPDNRPLADQSLLPSSYTGSSAVPSKAPLSAPAVPQVPYGSQLTASAVAQVAGGAGRQGQQVAMNTAQQVVANKELQEELAKNPGVNIGELLGNLSSSMIATEDDAAMALQISNALTQALLKFRLQHAKKQLSKTESSKPSEKNIPGLGTSTVESDKSVPSFLRTSTSSQSSSEQQNYDLSLPQVTSKRSSSSHSDVPKTPKKARQQPPPMTAPQTDLLKSIREQAAKLQAQISSKTQDSTSNLQPGIQTDSQFVHYPNPYGAQSAVSMATSSQSPGQGHSVAFSSSAVQYPGITGQYSNAGGLDYSQPVVSSSESTVTHVNPSFYAHWYKTMYGKDISMTMSQPAQASQSQLATTTQVSQPATSADWYKTMYGQDVMAAPQPAPPAQPPPPPPPLPVSEPAPAPVPPPLPQEVVKNKK